MEPVPRFECFNQFWRYYLAEHRQPATRAWHFAATSAAAIGLGAIVATRHWRWLPAVPLAGYGLAWLSHAAIEGNRPTTVHYPLWSLAADLKMWALIASGRMRRELIAIAADDADARNA